MPAEAPNFSFIGQIAQGGQKTVFKVTNHEFGECVMKVMRSDSKEAIERAARELDAAQDLGSCSHRFPQIHWDGWVTYQGSQCFAIVEEYIPGPTLRLLLQRYGSLELDYVSWLGYEILCSLQEIHALNVVHRDIKPENIMIANSGARVVVLDLGIARHLDCKSITNDLAAMGPLTFGYAAPEQILNRKRAISARTDLFSWGVVMYECIAGENPFVANARGSDDVVESTLRMQPEDLDTGDNPLGLLVKWCMQKPCHLRPTSAMKVAQILKRVVGG